MFLLIFFLDSTFLQTEFFVEDQTNAAHRKLACHTRQAIYELLTLLEVRHGKKVFKFSLKTAAILDQQTTVTRPTFCPGSSAILEMSIVSIVLIYMMTHCLIGL